MGWPRDETANQNPSMKAKTIVNDVQYSSRTNSYRAEFDKEHGPSVTVVGLVCSALDRAITDLPPLNDAVDPDALDTLFQNEDPDRKETRRLLEFSYADCTVRVESDGYVVVVPGERTPTIQD